MSSIEDLFNHFMSLVGLNHYNKTETDTKYATKEEIPPSLTIVDNLTTNDNTKVLSAKQGKVLGDMIGEAITYINL